MTAYFLLKALHVLAAVVWVGGMFFAILVLRPSLSVLERPQRLALHDQVFQRFFRIIWHVMPLVILTGYAIIFSVFGGMAGVRWPVHLMTLLGLLMGAVFVLIYFVPYRRFRTTTELPVKAASADLIRKLITLNLALGLITIVVAHIG
jgi:uncharacterized membrane protein